MYPNKEGLCRVFHMTVCYDTVTEWMAISNQIF